MPRHRLLVMWRVNAVTVAVCATAVIGALVLPAGVRLWVSLATMIVACGAFVVVWRRRPRPMDTGWPSPRDRRELEAIAAAELIESATRRERALDQARRGVFSGLIALPTWAVQAVLWGSYEWSPLSLRAGVLPLIVLAAAWVLYRLAARIRVIDHYDDTVPLLTPRTVPDA